MIGKKRGDDSLSGMALPEGARRSQPSFMAKFPFPLSRRWTWILGIILGVVFIISALSYFIHSGPLRRYAEHQMNRHLKGYTVHVGRAYFHPIVFSLDLEDLILTQDAKPNPPVAHIKRLHASVHWREILTAHLVGDFLIDRPIMDLSYFKPITNRRNISVERGTLSTKGNLEYAPQMTVVNLKNLEIEGVHVDYLHLPQTAEVEKERVQKAAQTAKELSNVPSSKIRIDVLKIKDSSFGYLNRTSNPNYRLFIDHAEATLKNFSNQFVEGPATLELRGKFMGTGDARVTGVFRPETKNPDFDLNVAIENTQMPAMSDLFRSYGNFDIKAGLFSFYSELTIKGDTVNGYVKPLFKDMKVYDRRPESEKSLFHKLYVGLVGGISKLLENRPRNEVATKADISGPIGSPKTSTWQIIINLIQNAFIKSVLPGFEKETSGTGK